MIIRKDTFVNLWRTIKRLFTRRVNKSGTYLIEAEVRDHRLNICKACPHFSVPGGQCDVCTCFVSLKTMIRDEHCPKNYW
jgi:hypothetical protein